MTFLKSAKARRWVFFSVMLGALCIFEYQNCSSSNNNNSTSTTTTTTAIGTSTVYGQTIIADGPQFYWTCGDAAGSTTMVDSGGAAADPAYPSIQNGGSYTLGVAGGIFNDATTALNLSDGGLVYTTLAGLNTPLVGSIEAWISTTTQAGGVIMGFGNEQYSASQPGDRLLYMDTTGAINFGVVTGSNTKTVITSPKSYNDGGWHHLVATFNSSGTKLYVDGALVESSSVAPSQSFQGNWSLGYENVTTWPNSPGANGGSVFYSGNMMEVAVYSYVLNLTKIQNHYIVGTTGN